MSFQSAPASEDSSTLPSAQFPPPFSANSSTGLYSVSSSPLPIPPLVSIQCPPPLSAIQLPPPLSANPPLVSLPRSPPLSANPSIGFPSMSSTPL
ncbi:unnamed protein product [Staurois parvus]|uniref:Uncharacterized protein n=1 Tax=Staurois parvus TaxID=386267 RepID=A0ABN9G5L5_9NEOB|nr:unnamed protein product [Staurois parvus]